MTTLPPVERGTVSLVEAARLLGVGKSSAYELAHAGTFPVRVIPIGRRLRVPVADLLRVLGMPVVEAERPAVEVSP